MHHFYNAAGLKNHVHAKHGFQAINDSDSDMASQTSSPVLDQLPSPQMSDSEQDDEGSTAPLSPLFPADGVPMDVDFEHQPPLPFPNVYDEHDDRYSDCDSPSSPPIIPSSPGPGLQHGSTSRTCGHQQTAPGDNFIQRVYHDKLTGEFIMSFSHLSNLYITFRSER
jgi:hypothetical protein